MIFILCQVKLFSGIITITLAGTSVGNPIEANAAGETFWKNGSSIRVRSVKGNIGYVIYAYMIGALVE